MPELKRRWINGHAHALVLDYDQRGLPALASLVRKRDGAVLVRWSLANGTHPRIARKRPPLPSRDLLGEMARLEARFKAGTAAQRLLSRQPRRKDWLQGLGVPTDILRDYRLQRCDEPGELVEAGRDRGGRSLWLTPAAARAWLRMSIAARRDGVVLEPVSGFRSAAYQRMLIARKRARGLDWDAILSVSALPGFSEHHLGTTLDLHGGDGAVLEESFENTAAFAWLSAHAGRFSFRLSYPRDNPHGIAYEPWHWRFHPQAGQ